MRPNAAPDGADHWPPPPPEQGSSGKRRPSLVQFDEAWLRIADISHFRWERGHSFTKLVLTMSDGAVYSHKDWNGSAYVLEKRLLAAIEGQA